MKLVECVPNFSEGRDPATIEAIAAAIRSVETVALLDVDPGRDTHRTVVTLLGPPEAVLEAAYSAVRAAVARIDMRRHKGAHARMGAADVVPFVPVREVSMAECVELARQLGQRIGQELGLPVYLYEQAASRPERRNLAEVRRGEYEGLAAKLADPAWAPDFGPAEFVPRSGAVITGAREFLIAYNFNLNTLDRAIAHDIALEIREAGRALRDERGEILRAADGKALKQPGKFRHVKAVGWFMEDYGCAQVSMNLTDHKATGLAEVFDEVCRQAEQRGVRVTGSELVGVIPADCLIQAGRYFLRKANKSAGVPEAELIRLAVRSLGLGELEPFDLDEKIIERRIPDPRPLARMSLAEFCDAASRDSPAPGGGSVAALCGALSAALASMAANLTVGRKGHERDWGEMGAVAERAQATKDFFLRAIDDDSAAFDRVMAALRLPKKTPEDRAARKAAVQETTRGAVEVPLSVLQRSREAIELAEAVVGRANPAALSDAGVSGLCARTAAEGAYYNVVINLAGIRDPAWAMRIRNQADPLLEDIRRRSDALSEAIRKRLLANLTGGGGH